MPNIILASKSKVRKEILDNHKINIKVEASNVDEGPINCLLYTSPSPRD